MSDVTNERIITTFEKKVGSDLTKLTLTNYRVSLESSGSWLKKVKGVQSVTLESVHSANLVVRHNPSYLGLCIIAALLLYIAYSEYSYLVPSLIGFSGGELTTLIGAILFLIGLLGYFRSRSSGISIMSRGNTISMDARNVKGDAYDFVSKVMQEIANSKK